MVTVNWKWFVGDTLFDLKKPKPPHLFGLKTHIWRDWIPSFFLKIRSIRGVSCSERPIDGKSYCFSGVFWPWFRENCKKRQSLRTACPMVFQILKFIFGACESAHACLECFWCHSDIFVTQLTRSTRTPEDLVRQVVKAARFLPGWGQVTAPYLVAIFPKSANPSKPQKLTFHIIRPQTLPPPLPFPQNNAFFEKIERQTFFF